MIRNSSTLALGVVLSVIGAAEARGQLAAELIERGKAATALVEVTHGEEGGSGTAFCVEKSGLFITNAHVVEDDAGKEGTVRLVLDIGRGTQRSLPAKVVRRDDEMDLALLQIEPGAGPGLTPLALGQEAALKELAEVVTFGYPFGKDTAVGRAEFPDMTVLPSRITSLRRDKGRLLEIQFDNQLNPGNSGGPVLDGAGNVVGVVRAGFLGAALNLAISVNRLAEFLEAPGLVFDPPEFSYIQRATPQSWVIRALPARGKAALPEDLSVAITMKNDVGQPRTIMAKRQSAAAFSAIVLPVARDPDWRLDLTVALGASREHLSMRVGDADVRGGATRFMMSVLRNLLAGRPPRAPSAQAGAAKGSSLRLATAKRKTVEKTTTFDLNQAEQIDVWARDPARTQTVVAEVEARQGTKVLATVRRRTKLEVPKGIDLRLKENIVVVITPRPQSAPKAYRPLVDDGRLELGGVVDARAIPLGAGKSIRPPAVTLPAARLTSEATDAPLVLRVEGTISDVTAGAGGRFLILTLKDAQKLAVFDVNAAEVVKTIPLPSANVLVAAGARKLLIAFPDERVVQRWDLETLQRDGGSRPWPIDGRLIRLAMGSDSDGPALAMWSTGAESSGSQEARFSFIDPETLKVARVGLVATRGGRSAVSTSGGSFTLNMVNEWTRLRAGAGGAVFAMSDGNNGVATLLVIGRALLSPYEHVPCGYACPGPDGRSIFTGFGGRLDIDGKPAGIRGPAPKGAPEITVPSSDPAYYLSIGGLADTVTGYVDASMAQRRAPAGAVKASIHAADGSRLFTVHGLDEMAFEIKYQDQSGWAASPFTLDKRFVFVPRAQLLITIPVENDRLVLRRLNVDLALERAGGRYLFVVSPLCVAATAGQKLEHQIVARSSKGGVTCALVQGPDGMNVAPDGMVTWQVPEKLAGEDVAATIAVKDAAVQERSIVLAVRVE